MTVDLSKLEATIAIVLQNVRDTAGREVSIDSDFYRWFSYDRFFDVYEFKEEDVTVGQLTDDMIRLERIRNGDLTSSLSDLSSIAAVLIGLQNKLLQTKRS